MTASNELEEGNRLALDFEKRGGLLPVVAQDAHSGQILMLGYANPEALEKTLTTGMATFWSTSRGTLWTKGETSGDFLRLVEVLTDCDQDALVYRVIPQGAGACHTQEPGTAHARGSCFYRRIDPDTRLLEFL